ncbi:MAG TPA: hypothetical protein VGD69_21170 [Herpetosiphonaceae bacterium]
MQPVQLSLSLNEVNTVLEALGQMPYIKVYQLIGKIQQQAQEQLQQEQRQAAEDGHVGPS